MIVTWRFVVLVALAAIPVMVFPSWGTTGIALAGVVLVAFIDWLATASPATIRLQRTPGRRVRLGHETDSTLTVINAGTRTASLHIRDAWPPSAGAQDNRLRVRLAAGEQHENVTRLVPTRRGELPADLVTVRVASPLRLCFRQQSVEVPAAIRVLPPFVSRKHLPSKLARLRELDGRTLLMTRGMGTEFDSLREYVRGDDVRSIDWRATARAQHLMVKTWRPERDRRVVIVLDSSRLAARRMGDGTAFDAAMEAAMLLGALASGGGDRVDILVADARVRRHIGPISGSDPLGIMTNDLADVFPELIDADWNEIVTQTLRLSTQRAFVVFLTALDERTIAQDMLPALPVLRARHRLAIASVADPDLGDLAAQVYSPAQVYRAAAAEHDLLTARSLGHALADAGIHTVHAEPEDLAPQLADLYISLKASGKL
ncbi:DUF58 domain-containing protein [Brevibacterium luteolum]|uniref:DUF58 domain-containing protein n=1 Tax=Brevibacterium luteolum TaxID=199591 RepID=A0A6G8KVL8_9MICO|nr:DUF58 domain-containing protein [Brevibacterium luteolum]QIN28852.1 DUF58 domain-containing protein [Brevibacterium luteolum]